MKSRLFFFLLFLASLIGFQNCDFAPMKFTSSGNLLTDPKLNDNGQGYAGLQKGQYFQLVPDFTCEQKESPVAQISVSDAGVLLMQNKILACGVIKQNLDPKLIDSSIYQKQIIGYQEGIFEGKDSTPTTIPANLVEIWCRDRNDRQGIESLTHYDRSTKLAMNQIYYSARDKDGNQIDKEIPNFPVARLVSGKSILVKDGKDFELTVYRDKPAPQMGLFLGQLKAMIDGQKITRETYCRLGGSVAPSVWPAKQIVDFSVTNFKISPDARTFAYLSQTATGVSNLYAALTDGSLPRQVAPNMLLLGVWDFLFTADSQSLIYNGDPRIKYIQELFKANIDGSNTRQMNDKLVTSSQNTFGTFKLSPDGQFLFYLDASQTFDSGHPWLKSVPINGGPPIIFNQTLSAGMGSHLSNFDTSISKNKVVYIGGTFYSDLFSANFDGTNIRKITPSSISVPALANSLSSSDWYLDWHEDVNVPHGGDFALIRANNLLLGSKFYGVAIDGSGSIELPTNWIWKFSSLSGDFAVLQNSETKTAKRKLMNFKTGTTIDLPSLKYSYFNETLSPKLFDNSPLFDQWDSSPIFFSKNSNFLISTEVLADGHYQPVALATADGTINRFCPQARSSQVMVRELDENKFLVLSYQQSIQILTVYIATAIENGTSSCFKVNSAPLENSSGHSLVDVTISPDKQKILLNLGTASLDPNGWVRSPDSGQLLYIPLNGKPALRVSTPVFEQARISRALFTADSQNVLYIGDQIQPGSVQVFRWTPP